MPHIVVEYTQGVDTDADMQALARALHTAATTCGNFPVGGVRTMLRPTPFSLVGDASDHNAFVNVTVRIGPGRAPELKHKLAKMFFDAAEGAVAGVFDKRPAALQVELSDFDPAVTFSRNTMIPPPK